MKCVWGLLACMWEMKNAYRILVGKPKWKRLCSEHRCCWKDIFKMGFKEMGHEGVNRINLVRIWTSAGSCEHNIDILGCIESGKFLTV
jgi:hypothetical protein